MKLDKSQLDWNKVQGLMPCVVQNQKSGQVLMLGYMNEEALDKSLSEDKLTFWSRTKNRLWTKGESSGNSLILKSLHVDCDNDTLLALVEPIGPTCHLGSESCFGEKSSSQISFLSELEELIHQRKLKLPDSSYTTSLFKEGQAKIAQKVGEEAVETVIAALAETDDRVLEESADLLFHLIVLLEEKELRFSEVVQRLIERHR